MRRFSQALAATAIAGSALIASGGSASATSDPYHPNVARVAYPSVVCTSIIGSIRHANYVLGSNVTLPGFNYAECVRTLSAGKAVVEPVEVFGNPYKQCDKLGLPYPFTFHDTKSVEDRLLPDLIATNRRQCGNSLYAFHVINDALFPAQG